MAVMTNPFRPGAGQMPPYLAGRQKEREEFEQILKQSPILKNLIITGLRGTGKTVLAENLKPAAYVSGWTWVGADLSESASVSEETLATRLLTDLSVITSKVPISREEAIGFDIGEGAGNLTMGYNVLRSIYANQPGLATDKLKATLEFSWRVAGPMLKTKGIVFVYDEAQNLHDAEKDKQYPLSLLLDVFQSMQRKGIPFLLLLVGLPTLFPKLVATRTYSERMFAIIELKSLSPAECAEAILKPTKGPESPVTFTGVAVETIVRKSGGYPYFIQFICREAFDSFLSQLQSGIADPSVPIAEIVAKLDTEFFSGRWDNLADRQRELLSTIARLDEPESEFTIHDVIEASSESLVRPFHNNSMVNQMLSKLAEQGLVYRTRHGKYRLGIPLLSEFINRQKT